MIMTRAVCAGLLYAASQITLAQELPSPPQAKTPAAGQIVPVHHFFNKTNKLTISASFGLRTLDAVYTCQLLNRSPRVINGQIYTFHEIGLPTQSCAGVVLTSEAIAGAGVGVAYLFHKAGLHWLEAPLNGFAAVGGAVGFIVNKQRVPHGF